MNPDRPSIYQVENRSDILLGREMKVAKDTAFMELRTLRFSSEDFSVSKGNTSPPLWEKLIAVRLLYLLHRDVIASRRANKILDIKNRKESFMTGVDNTPYLWQYCEDFGRGTVTTILSYKSSVRWLVLAVIWVLCFSMALCVLYFAYTQTTARQIAWAETFALWLVMDLLLISTLEVLLMDVYLPLLISNDVQSASEIISSLAKKLKENAIVQKSGAMKSHRNRLSILQVVGNQEDNDENNFNTAEHFFASFPLAKYFSRSSASPLVLSYQTIFPPGNDYFVKSRRRITFSYWSRWLRPLNYDLETKKSTKMNIFSYSARRDFNFPSIWSQILRGPLWPIQYCCLSIFSCFLSCNALLQSLILQVECIIAVCILVEIYVYLFEHYPIEFLAGPFVIALIFFILSRTLSLVMKILNIFVSSMVNSLRRNHLAINPELRGNRIVLSSLPLVLQPAIGEDGKNASDDERIIEYKGGDSPRWERGERKILGEVKANDSDMYVEDFPDTPEVDYDEGVNIFPMHSTNSEVRDDRELSGDVPDTTREREKKVSKLLKN